MVVNSQTKALKTVLNGLRRLNENSLSSEGAAAVLEQSATIRKRGSRVRELGYPALISVLEIYLRASVDPTQAPLEIRAVDETCPASEGVRIARGVDVYLTEGDKLAGVVVRPVELREGLQLMSFVGIGRDTATDVAEKHDDYLVDAYLNAGKHGED